MCQRSFLKRTAVLLSLCQLTGLGPVAIQAADDPSIGSGHPPLDVPYGLGNWDARTLGNHRAVLEVGTPGQAVWAHIPWRRRDARPELKHIIVVEAATGRVVTNTVALAVASAFGDLVFQAPAAGAYHAYYLPSLAKGKNYPSVTYQPPQNTADPAWLKGNGLDSKDRWAATLDRLPRARVMEFQAIDQFNSFDPMEVVATDE